MKTALSGGSIIAACAVGSIAAIASLGILILMANVEIVPFDWTLSLAKRIGRESAIMVFFTVEAAIVALVSMIPAFALGLVQGALWYRNPNQPAMVATVVVITWHTLAMFSASSRQSIGLMLVQYSFLAVFALLVFVISGKIGAWGRSKINKK